MPLIATSGGVSKGAAPLKTGPGKSGTTTPNSYSTKGLQMGAPTMGIAQSSIGQTGTGLGSGAPAAPYLDPTALANIADYLNKTGNTISNDQASITQDQTGLASTIATDKQNNQLANLKMMTGANVNGGLYGSAYGQQLGNQNTAYGQKETDATSSANDNITKLTNAIAELNASEPIYASQQAAAAAGRASAAAAKDAPAALPAASKPASAPAPKIASASQIAAARGSAANKQLKQNGTPMGGFR